MNWALARLRRCACCRGCRYHAIVGNSLMTMETNREKPLRLALIGMCGAGKTLWTRKVAATAEEQQVVIERYLSDPKRVLWRRAFQPRAGENPRETVARCYPALISARRQGYEALAHCALQVAALRDGSLDAPAFLKMIQSKTGTAR